jgi:hypothetical protein
MELTGCVKQAKRIKKTDIGYRGKHPFLGLASRGDEILEREGINTSLETGR